MASNHLADDELAKLALQGRDDPHIASCSTCAEALASFRSLIDRLRALPDPPGSLLDASLDFYRRRRKLESLVERLAEDPALRARAHDRPEDVLRAAGLEPIPELLELLRDEGRAAGDVARRIAAKRLWL